MHDGFWIHQRKFTKRTLGFTKQRKAWCYLGFCSNVEFDGMLSKPTLPLEDGAKFMNSFNKSVKHEARVEF